MLTLTGAIWRFFKRQHRRQFNSWSSWRRVTTAIIMFVGFPLSGVFLSLWMLSIIPWPSLAGMSNTSSKIVWSLVLIVCAVVAGLMGIGGLWATLSLRRSLLELPISLVNGVTVLGWIAVILSFCIWVGVFMIAAYPNIPEQFGGGKARSVQLLLEEEAVEGAKELGVPVISGKHLSVPVDLIYDGSQTYVIELDSGKIVQLDKSMVTGIANTTSSLQYRVQ
jgi:hypothetical protein